jgi:hypothetical protein
MPRDGWGKPPPREPSIVELRREWSREQQLPDVTSPVTSPAAKLAAMSPEERQQRAREGREGALQRLRGKVVVKSNLPTSKTEDIRVQRQRAALSNLRYRF